VLFLCLATPHARGAILINEFMASNTHTAPDPLGHYEDWIELYNNSATAVNLAGLYLTDDPTSPTKWKIPSTTPAETTVAGSGYLIVWADQHPTEGSTHADFKLSGEGEDLLLVDRDGATVLDWVHFGPQYADVSYGRYPNGGAGWRYYDPATFRAANTGGYLGLVEKVRTSHARGVYQAPFEVTLTCDTPGASIHYTLNGSDPTAASTLYTKPISVSKTTTLRARAFLTGWRPSSIDTHTYIFYTSVRNQSATPAGFPTTWVTQGGLSVPADYEMDPTVLNSTNGPKLEPGLASLPILSIVTNVNHLFSQSTGIYANPTERGETWERPTSVEWMDTATGDDFQIDAGVRIQGAWFRQPDQNQKHSLRLLFKTDYGPSKLNFPFFTDSSAVGSFDTLTLRANANDGYSWAGRTDVQFIRDEFGRRSQLAVGQPSCHGRFVHLFINGLYWGLYNPTERPAAPFAASYFGGKKEDWDIVSKGEVVDGSIDPWNRLLSTCRAGVKSNEAYQQVQGRNPDGTVNPAFENLIDLDNYIDYMIVNHYIGNGDWPWNNWSCGRDRVANSGFRFFMWDAEWSIGMNSDLNTNRTQDYAGVAEPYGALKANPEFRMRFADHLHKHYFNGGALTPEVSRARYQELANIVEPSLVAESARWGDMHSETPLGPTEWYAMRDWALNTYFPQRTAISLQQYRDTGLYPKTDAPEYQVNSQPKNGGLVIETDQISLTSSQGTIYYTLDGTDPRLPNTAPTTDVTLVPEKAPKTAFVPIADIGTAWRGGAEPFDDSTWQRGDSTTGSLILDGTDDYAEFDPAVGSSPSLTVAFWMKADQLKYQIPVDKLPQDGNAGWTFKGRDNGDLWFRIGSENNHTDLAASGAYAIGQWVHIAATYTGGSAKLYINGVAQAEQSGIPQTVDNTEVPLRFGIASLAWASETFTGALDDVRIYSTALNPAQIATLLNRQEVATSLVARYDLDEVGGVFVGDDSGNGYYGTLSGGAVWSNPGVLGVGYENGSGYESYIGIKVGDAMYNKMGSCYIRIPFDAYAAQLKDLSYLTLRMRFDDGFYAYLNGTKIAQANYPTADPAWNSEAGQGHSDTEAVNFMEYDVSQYRNLLKPGRNILAIQGLNTPLNSTDFLISAELVSGTGSTTETSVSTNTLEYKGPFSIPETTHIKARVLNGNEWSALSEATFTIGSAVDNLRITEVMYNPPAPPAGSPYASDDFEYLELQNIGSTPLSLPGIRFVEGISFTYPAGPGEATTATLLRLQPGQYVAIARNIATFQSRYGTGIPVAGPYSGALSNGGESLWLQDAQGKTILRFAYQDSGDWPGRADGHGSSLEALDATLTSPTACANGNAWRSSAEFNGSPGRKGLEPIAWVKINEVLTHTTSPLSDSIELVNVTTATLDLEGWYLSDSNTDYFKFRIPVSTPLPVGGYGAFDESDFNPTPLTPGPNDFSFDGAHGENAYLLAPTRLGTYRFVDHVEFGAAADGESFGRWPDKTGDLYPMASRTFGSANSGPRVGPLVISEVQYNPGAQANADPLEFVEIHNPTATEVNLANWRLNKEVDFTFAAGTTLAPHGTLMVVSFNPNTETALKAAFLTAYGLSDPIVMVGPYVGRLNNAGGTVQLLRPDTPPADEPTFIPYLIEDEVRYGAQTPWPTQADGGGRSLTRLGVTLWGNDPASWAAEPPTPDTAFEAPTKPSITSIPETTVVESHIYSYHITALGNPAPTITLEGLPAWLVFDGIDRLYGVPAKADIGSHGPITVRATNSQDDTTQVFTIQVTAIPVPHPARFVIY
jgi:hypothetical protein